MPEVDGLEVLKYVRANEVLKDLPVVSEWPTLAMPAPLCCFLRLTAGARARLLQIRT